MKQKIEALIEDAKNTMGTDADVLIVTHKGGECGAVAHGDADKIAESIFSCLHQPDGTIATALYRIIYMNVMNILKNPSPYALHLINSINLIQPNDK